MSLAIMNITKRWREMCELRKKGLTTKNADQHYQKDVGDLLRVVESLRLTSIRHQMKLREMEEKEQIEFKVLYDQYGRAMDKLINSAILIKPNG